MQVVPHHSVPPLSICQIPIFPIERGDLAVSYLPAWHAYGRTLE